MIRIRHTAALLLAAVLAAGCGSAPRAPDSGRAETVPAARPGDSVVRIAQELIGSPYRYGATGPGEFDCSGLVFFSHRQLGIAVPRTAAEQRRAAEPVPVESLVPGDLVFFRISGRKVDHVGIYAGAGKFIHAPGRGRVVSYAYLQDPYYRKRFAGAGRLWPLRAARAGR